MRPRSGLALRARPDAAQQPGHGRRRLPRRDRGDARSTSGQEPARIRRGDRIAQLVVQRVPAVAWTRSTTLPETARGAGGFGHTGERELTLRVVPLGSGSRGNATLVEFGAARACSSTPASRRATLARAPARRRASTRARSPRSCCRTSTRTTRAAPSASRSATASRCICASETLEALDLLARRTSRRWQPLGPASRSTCGDVVVEPFPVPHDAARPVGFVLHGEGLRVGVATDLGHATTLVRRAPARLPRAGGRVEPRRPHAAGRALSVARSSSASPGALGHLSNDEAAALLRDVVDDACRGGRAGAPVRAATTRPALARRAAARRSTARRAAARRDARRRGTRRPRRRSSLDRAAPMEAP